MLREKGKRRGQKRVNKKGNHEELVEQEEGVTFMEVKL